MWKKKWARRNARGTIYMLFDEPSDLVKIGFTQMLDTRRKTLERELGRPLLLLGVRKGTPTVERQIHARLATYRGHGEWFALGDDRESIVDAIVRRAIP